jgi:hypothetical protein
LLPTQLDNKQRATGTVPLVQRGRSRVGALFLTAATFLALLAVGVTVATWTDSEWAGDGSYDIAEGTRFNLQISNDPVTSAADSPDAPTAVSTLTWLDTSQDDLTQDGAFENDTPGTALSVQPHLPASDQLCPGWQATTVLNLKNDSTLPAALTLQAVLPDATPAAAQAVAEYFSLDVTLWRPTLDGDRVADWTEVTPTAGAMAGVDLASLYSSADGGQGPWPLLGLAAGEWVQVRVTLTWDAGNSLTDTPAPDNPLAGLLGADPAGFHLRFAAGHVTPDPTPAAGGPQP